MRKVYLTAAMACLLAAPAFAGQDTKKVQNPTKEYVQVTFVQPVRVGTTWLLGTYVIEHDKERMAQGKPCTHIYTLKDRRKPLVAFHCEHIDRAPASQAKITLRRTGFASDDVQLGEFQFRESSEGHGVPKSLR